METTTERGCTGLELLKRVRQDVAAIGNQLEMLEPGTQPDVMRMVGKVVDDLGGLIREMEHDRQRVPGRER